MASLRQGDMLFPSLTVTHRWAGSDHSCELPKGTRFKAQGRGVGFSEASTVYDDDSKHDRNEVKILETAPA